MNITPSPLKINLLLGSPNEQYVIPSYQRRYSWQARQVWEFIDDIRLLEDGDTHLLGTIVCLTGEHTAGLNKLELVDGQQRLTTITIVLTCIQQHLESKGQSKKATEIAGLLAAQAFDGDPHLRNLRMIKAVQTYGFLMHLRTGKCSKPHFRKVLALTENFVLRRHVCRERANETEALFARLCAVDPSDPVVATKEAYRELCPSDDKFREEFAAASFPATLIDRARYCLEHLEEAKHGQHDELQVLGASDVHVEHIIPQKIKTKKSKEQFGDWIEYLGEKAEALHPKYVARIRCTR